MATDYQTYPTKREAVTRVATRCICGATDMCADRLEVCGN